VKRDFTSYPLLNPIETLKREGKNLNPVLMVNTVSEAVISLK
jgi:hypothetical protein